MIDCSHEMETGKRNMYNCLSPNCPQVFKKDNCHISCDICQKSYCAECQVPDHTGKTCKEYKESSKMRSADEQANLQGIQELLRAGLLKKCPKCSNVVDKDDGCNRVDCMHCGIVCLLSLV